MPGSTGAGLRDDDKAVVAEVGRRYDSNQHLRDGAGHTEVLSPEFVDRFAVVGAPERCIARLQGLAELGLDRFIITTSGLGSDVDTARAADRRLVGEVLPALHEEQR